MRKIGYRIWVDNEMEDVKVLNLIRETATIATHEGPLEVSYKNNPIMQFTGLKDKNGKEIFEGDILRCNKWGIGQVVYRFPDGRNNIYGFVIHIRGNTLPVYVGFNKLKISYEIIGNIYENPELLKS